MTQSVSKKILHVTFNMGIGGTEQVIRQIIENSDPEIFTHEILCIDGFNGSLGLELKEKGINVECIMRRPGFDINLILSLHQLIKLRKVDVLHCHQYTPYFYGVISSILTESKVIFTEHGRFYPDIHHFKRRIINPLILLRTKNITAISNSTADAVSKYEYIPRKKIQVIYNGIRVIEEIDQSRDELLSELNLDPRYRYIGTVSRLDPIKNQSMMINAFAQAKKNINSLRLILIGDGPSRGLLEDQVKMLGLNKEVIFTGFINNPQKYIKTFEVFLLSSFSEGTSMTLLEAMALSKPCVVTNVGGNPEIVENEISGRVVPSNDISLFSHAIVDILNDSVLSKSYGETGNRKLMNEFSVDRMINSYEKLYLS